MNRSSNLHSRPARLLRVALRVNVAKACARLGLGLLLYLTATSASYAGQYCVHLYDGFGTLVYELRWTYMKELVFPDKPLAYKGRVSTHRRWGTPHEIYTSMGGSIFEDTKYDHYISVGRHTVCVDMVKLERAWQEYVDKWPRYYPRGIKVRIYDVQADFNSGQDCQKAPNLHQDFHQETRTTTGWKHTFLCGPRG